MNLYDLTGGECLFHGLNLISVDSLTSVNIPENGEISQFGYRFIILPLSVAIQYVFLALAGIVSVVTPVLI